MIWECLCVDKLTEYWKYQNIKFPLKKTSEISEVIIFLLCHFDISFIVSTIRLQTIKKTKQLPNGRIMIAVKDTILSGIVVQKVRIAALGDLCGTNTTTIIVDINDFQITEFVKKESPQFTITTRPMMTTAATIICANFFMNTVSSFLSFEELLSYIMKVNMVLMTKYIDMYSAKKSFVVQFLIVFSSNCTNVLNSSIISTCDHISIKIVPPNTTNARMRSQWNFLDRKNPRSIVF